MLPKITSKREEDDILHFSIKDMNVSLINAIRRTILTDIPSVVFHTFPYSENNCEIQINTSRFNNEIIKHRLSLVPIHITDLTIPLDNYLLEIKKKNDTNNIEYITSEDFQIKDIQTGKYLSKGDRDNIFPKNSITGHYIEFLRLRPKLASNLAGEELSLTCKFSISTAKENSTYNQTSTCTYKNTIDTIAINDAWSKKEKEYKEQGLSKEDIEFEKKNWMLLDAQRIFTPNSFDFILKSIGIYDNTSLVKMACDIMLDSIDIISKAVETDDRNVIQITDTVTTIQNCYDIILHNYDYTIGKVLEYYLYKLHYEGDQTLSFCGFNKEHPHDDHSILRIAFKNQSDKNVAKQYMRDALSSSTEAFTEIKEKI
jgi:DNA-directed RNA polymerase subunit L